MWLCILQHELMLRANPSPWKHWCMGPGMPSPGLEAASCTHIPSEPQYLPSGVWQAGTGWAEQGASTSPPSPTFRCSVAPTVEGWVAAGPSDDVLLQTQYQKGQNNAWLLHLPSVPAILAQHLSLPLNAQPVVPSPCPQTCFS